MRNPKPVLTLEGRVAPGSLVVLDADEGNEGIPHPPDAVDANEDTSFSHSEYRLVALGVCKQDVLSSS